MHGACLLDFEIFPGTDVKESNTHVLSVLDVKPNQLLSDYIFADV